MKRRSYKKVVNVDANISGYRMTDLVPNMAIIAHADRHDSRNSCCTVHEIRHSNGAPRLRPGKLATKNDLRNALELIENGIPSTQLTANRKEGYTVRDIIYKSEQVKAWLRPASVETLLIGGRLDMKYNNKSMAIPEMLFITGLKSGLTTLCCLSPGRPRAETEVCPSPFPNTSPNGNVCLNGGMNINPEAPNFEIDVENLYLNTRFTHTSASHPLNTNAKLRRLWEAALEKAASGGTLSPADFLTPKFPRFKLERLIQQLEIINNR